MVYSLTVGGYTFENPPEEYRKLARLSNSPQTAFNRRSTAFFQSDSQDLQFQVEGTLALDPALGGTDDLDELAELQDLAIEGGEVAVEFDPFFSGRCVIEDDPFRQEDGESSYQFTFTVNSEDTDDSAYPSHNAPDTGNTFEFGDLDLGYDPNQVSQNYERQTEKVKRLQGIARSVDTEGLIPKVQISGLIDGGGQAQLWDKARSNVLAYLSAEFQNGWALVDSLSIRNTPEAPDYLTGMFRYDLDLLIVMDPGSGIGEVSKFVDREVQDQTTYVSNCDEDGILERLGNDTEDYPYALDYRISGGTGKLDGDYVQWDEEFGTLAQSTTNYIWVEDGDGDGYGNVNTGTSGFPGNTVPLYEVDTGTSSVNDIRDQRVCLTGSRLEPEDLGDLNFLDDLAVDDRLNFERILALPPDSLAVSDPIERWLGIADLTDSLAVAEGLLDARAIQPFPQETVILDDGGSATGDTQTGTSETISWADAADWDGAASESGVSHENVANTHHTDAGSVSMGFDYSNPTADNYYPLHEDSGSTLYDIAGSINGTINSTPGVTGVLNSTAHSYNGSGEYDTLDSQFPYQPKTIEFLVNPDMDFDGTNDPFYMVGASDNGNDWFSFGDVTSQISGETFTIAGANANGRTGIDETITAGVWHYIVIRWNGSTYDIWLDGTNMPLNESNMDALLDSGPYDFGARHSSNSDGYLPADLSDFAFHADAVSDQYILDRWDALTSAGELTTATKSFSSGVKPKVKPTLTMNGTADMRIDVVGSPGTGSEEIKTIQATGTGEYDPEFGNTHSDFRVIIYPDNEGDRSVSQVVDSVDLSFTSSGDDSDQNPNTVWEIRGAKYDTSGNEYEGGGTVARYGG